MVHCIYKSFYLHVFALEAVAVPEAFVDAVASAADVVFVADVVLHHRAEVLALFLVEIFAAKANQPHVYWAFLDAALQLAGAW